MERNDDRAPQQAHNQTASFRQGVAWREERQAQLLAERESLIIAKSAWEARRARMTVSSDGHLTTKTDDIGRLGAQTDSFRSQYAARMKEVAQRLEGGRSRELDDAKEKWLRRQRQFSNESGDENSFDRVAHMHTTAVHVGHYGSSTRAADIRHASIEAEREAKFATEHKRAHEITSFKERIERHGSATRSDDIGHLAAGSEKRRLAGERHRQEMYEAAHLHEKELATQKELWQKRQRSKKNASQAHSSDRLLSHFSPIGRNRTLSSEDELSVSITEARSFSSNAEISGHHAKSPPSGHAGTALDLFSFSDHMVNDLEVSAQRLPGDTSSATGGNPQGIGMAMSEDEASISTDTALFKGGVAAAKSHRVKTPSHSRSASRSRSRSVQEPVSRSMSPAGQRRSAPTVKARRPSGHSFRRSSDHSQDNSLTDHFPKDSSSTTKTSMNDSGAAAEMI